MKNLMITCLLLIPSLLEARGRPAQSSAKLSFDVFVDMCEMDQGTPSRTTRGGKVSYNCSYDDGDKITCDTSGNCTSASVRLDQFEKMIQAKALEAAQP
jgi:hypothetical protein